MAKRIVIVGGVAAGASAAAKARRTAENIEIVLVEAGGCISFANCGLPYYVGGEITRRSDLFVIGDDVFAQRFAVDVRLNTTVTAVDRRGKTVTLDGPDGPAGELAYDRLILATGTEAIRPPIPGLDRENIFTVRTVPDVDAITAHLKTAGPDGNAPQQALVIGGGYIGLETAEQLLRRGLKVTLVEMADQLMLALDPEMAWPLEEELRRLGAEVILSDAVAEIADGGGQAVARTRSGREIPFDLGVLAVGVRPNVALARAAGLVLGKTGAIQVDRHQRTSDAGIYAAGDNSEAPHLVLNRPVNIPLAGPANKAGRVAGANAALDLISAGDTDARRMDFRGVLGTAIVRIGEKTAAVTALTEQSARREDLKHQVVYLAGPSHAGYYPGAEGMILKLLYAPATGKILGAQIVGGDGVDKRIDVLATAIAAGMAVEDLENLDLAYAPPFSSARDPDILTGFAAANIRRGLMPSATPAELLSELAGDDPPTVIDVRTPKEFAAGRLAAAVNIPLHMIRDRLAEIPTDRPVVLHCHSGYRSYVAQRILMNNGRQNVRNILGGWLMIDQTQKAQRKNQA